MSPRRWRSAAAVFVLLSSPAVAAPSAVVLGAPKAVEPMPAVPAVPAPGGVQRTDTDAALALVASVAGDALRAVQSPPAERQRGVRAIFDAYVDQEAITAAAIGSRIWQQLTAEQRGELTRAYADFAVRQYAGSFAVYAGELLDVVGVQTVGPGLVQVNTVLRAPRGTAEPLEIGWIVLADGRGRRVVDIILDGVSSAAATAPLIQALFRSHGSPEEVARLLLEPDPGLGLELELE